MAQLPRIALVGCEALTSSHGTGMMFARHFSNYPKNKLIDVHYRTAGTTYLFPKAPIESYNLDQSTWSDPWLKEINQSLAGKQEGKSKSLVYQNKVFAPIKINWKKFGGPPDLIYSTCFSAQNFAFLHHFYRSLDRKVPIIQHFLDLDMQDRENLVLLYRDLLPAI